MYIERIHFDEVFDVQPSRGDFSFRSCGRAYYGVNLQNGVVPCSGATFAVAFEQAGNWQRVVGSRDLASSKVVLTRPTWIDLLLQADFFLFSLPFIVGTLVLGAHWPGLVLAALLIFTMGHLVLRGMRVNCAARRALLDIEQHDADCDKGSPAWQDNVR